MAFEIDDAETEAIIWKLVALTGEPVDVAIRIAVEERLARLGAEDEAGTGARDQEPALPLSGRPAP